MKIVSKFGVIEFLKMYQAFFPGLLYSKAYSVAHIPVLPLGFLNLSGSKFATG